MDKIIYGGDSETWEGEPLTFQFWSAEADCEDIIFVNAQNATRKFFAYMNRMRTKHQHVIYVHNLEFDLPEFLYECKEELVGVGGDFDFTYSEWRVTGVYGKPTFCKLYNEKRNIRVLIVDSMAWAQTSLAQAAKKFCPNLPKLVRPKDLGERKFTAKDTAFCAYAMRDAEVAYYIGQAVEKIHRQFDIRQAVSLADMSAKIFRHHFLTYTIPQPNRDVVMGAWKSYHGGKNNVIPNAAPAWHMDVTALDISSAFPYAMHCLPSFDNKRLYKRLSTTRSAPRNLPEHGVYCVSGTAERCNWPVIFTHGFKPITGRFSNTWIHGYELNEALRAGEVKINRIRGFYYEAEKDNRPPALREFVNHFYRLKSREKDPVLRYMYKIILNSLYGKFIQTRKTDKVIYTDVDAEDTAESQGLVAGGMFHPFIASAITAHTRAYMHQIEHAHQAIHTATDGIYTRNRKPKRLAGYPRTGLGSLEIEGRGDLVLLRNKCYILYSPDGKTPSQFFNGKRIHKYAKHGFQGTVYDLERLVAYGGRRYTVSRPNRLKESLKRGLQVNKFVTRPYVLRVGPIAVK